MKRFVWKEILLLCAPIAIIGLGIPVLRAYKPGRATDAKVQLSVTSQQTQEDGKLAFYWEASAKGGPESNFMFGYSQRITARGHGRSQILLDTLGNIGTSIWSPSIRQTATAGTESLREDMTFPAEQLPIWTQKLEWQGDVVAAPSARNVMGSWGPLNSLALKNLALTQGSTRVVKRATISLPGGKIEPIQQCLLEEVNPQNAMQGADTCVTVQMFDQSRRVCRRLVAFDGHCTRVLWTDGVDKNQPHLISDQQQGWTPIWRYSSLFKLKDVPSQWGEITFLVDTVYEPDGIRADGTIECDLATIAKLKRLGWITSSRRLVVRKKGERTQPRVISKTPSSQLLGVQTSLDPKYWNIDVKLRYKGQRPDPNLNIPGNFEFFDTKGNPDGLEAESYVMKPGPKPQEWIIYIKVPRANLQRVRDVKLKFEVVDMD
ncbi:hypothetical protein EON80_25910, partial [bacterium]